MKYYFPAADITLTKTEFEKIRRICDLYGRKEITTGEYYRRMAELGITKAKAHLICYEWIYKLYKIIEVGLYVTYIARDEYVPKKKPHPSRYIEYQIKFCLKEDYEKHKRNEDEILKIMRDILSRNVYEFFVTYFNPEIAVEFAEVEIGILEESETDEIIKEVEVEWVEAEINRSDWVIERFRRTVEEAILEIISEMNLRWYI